MKSGANKDNLIHWIWNRIVLVTKVSKVYKDLYYIDFVKSLDSFWLCFYRYIPDFQMFGFETVPDAGNPMKVLLRH